MRFESLLIQAMKSKFLSIHAPRDPRDRVRSSFRRSDFMAADAEISNRRVRVKLTVVSVAALVCSMLSPPFGPSGRIPFGLTAVYLGALGILIPSEFGSYFGCLLGTVANLAYLATLICLLCRPRRSFALRTATCSVLAGVGSVIALRAGPSNLPGMTPWPGLGFGFFLWISAIALLWCASLATPELPAGHQGSAI